MKERQKDEKRHKNRIETKRMTLTETKKDKETETKRQKERQTNKKETNRKSDHVNYFPRDQFMLSYFTSFFNDQ